MAVGYAKQGNDIRTRWATRQSLWDASIVSTPVIWDNYDQGDTGIEAAKESRSPWIRNSISGGEESQVCFGNLQRWRNFATLSSFIHVPIGDGPNLADYIGDQISLDWRGKGMGFIKFEGISRDRIDSPDGKWSMLVMGHHFYRDDFFARVIDPEEYMALTQAVTVASSVGMAFGDWVEPVAGAWQKAIADGTTPNLTVRPIISVDSATQITIGTGGSLEWVGHPYSTGAIYLSQTVAGEAQDTEPASGRIKQVATAITINSLDLLDLKWENK